MLEARIMYVDGRKHTIEAGTLEMLQDKCKSYIEDPSVYEITIDAVENIGLFKTELEVPLLTDESNVPYLKEVQVEVYNKYNPKYGDDRLCQCGHPYHRHFDSYDDMSNAGCKYCGCYEFIEHIPDKKKNK